MRGEVLQTSVKDNCLLLLKSIVVVFLYYPLNYSCQAFAFRNLPGDKSLLAFIRHFIKSDGDLTMISFISEIIF